MIELMKEFCEEVPTFFSSYDHLYLLFKHRWTNCNRAMVQLQTDLLSPPAGRVQAKIARMIHSYFYGLPWLNPAFPPPPPPPVPPPPPAPVPLYTWHPGPRGGTYRVTEHGTRVYGGDM